MSSERPPCDFLKGNNLCGLGLGNCTAETCQCRVMEGVRQ